MKEVFGSLTFSAFKMVTILHVLRMEMLSAFHITKKLSILQVKEMIVQNITNGGINSYETV